MGAYMGHSILVTGLALVILLVVALPASYCLARFKFVSQKFLNTCFMAGLFINVNYIVVPIYLMLADGDKWLKGFLGSGFLLNNHIVVAIVYAATALPFTIYLLSSYFATLPHDFEEAAYIDGAGYWRTMLEIIFPMAKPSIITVILFNFLSFWNEYIIIKTLVTDRDQWTLPAGLLNLMQAQQSAAEYGPMYAGLVLVMLPVLILYICVQKNLTKGMTVGGLKG
jgi:N-acetylglucosamine transport system permease protein